MIVKHVQIKMEEGDLEYTAPSRFSVPKSMIVFLKKSVPFEDSFSWIISAQNKDDFWERVNSLPSSISFECHKLGAQMPLNSALFPDSSMEPIIEQFWYAHQLTLGNQPSTPKERMVPQATPQMVREVANDIPLIKIDDEDVLHIRNRDFSMNHILMACDSFFQGGKPWLFIDMEGLRSLYISIDTILEDGDPRYHMFIKQTYNLMRNLEIKTFAQFMKIVSNYFTINEEIETSGIDEYILESFQKLFKGVSDILSSTVLPPIIRQPTAWEATIGDALADQMDYSVGDRAAFSISSQGIASRMGGDPNDAFEEYSLSDMMFTNGDDDIFPLAYLHCQSDVQKDSNMPFIKDSLNMLVADVLQEKGYNEVQEPCVEILTDILLYELDDLSKFIKIKIKNTEKTPAQFINELFA